MQDDGGTKEKTSLRTTWNTFATRLSVNQGAGSKWKILIYYVGPNSIAFSDVDSSPHGNVYSERRMDKLSQHRSSSHRIASFDDGIGPVCLE